jgi:NADH-quinone oxidoreductase subunit E
MAMPEEANPLDKVDTIYEKYRNYTPLKSAVIPFLQEIQSEVGYISEPIIEHVSELMGLPTSHIYGVVTFYHQFRLTPKGKHLITVCQGTACHVKGSKAVYDLIQEELGITDSDTSSDGLFTLQLVRCVGACSLAPVMKVDETFYGGLDKNKVRRILNQYRRADQ